ncbi:hypothetical protein K443DRAFT_378684 [Laccaria amethystina LaAM-08-1]|uniref:Uncharacterized protein n=1 Tax=Laccaria amethystina LaAM-08-1 TaxID=1095629 RepID=A0A0C9XIY7_9AGAR|nr:hypothetical protein K443DRAFT_378684 [Laccaria amethystina LaAM-08-1]
MVLTSYSALHCRLHNEVSKMCLYVLYRDLHKSRSNRPLTISGIQNSQCAQIRS